MHGFQYLTGADEPLSYEVGRRRVPVSMLLDLSPALTVGIDSLLGETAKARAKREPAPVLPRYMECISARPESKQKFVMQVLD